MDEIRAFYEGDIGFDALSEPAKTFVTRRHLDDLTSISRGFGIIDRSGDADRHGPFVRISWALDARSGSDHRWVTTDELLDGLLDDRHLDEWVSAVAATDDDAEKRRVLTVLVDSWVSSALTDGIETDVAIELSFDEHGPLFRSTSSPVSERTGIEATLLDRLIDGHGGHRRSDVTGRVQVSLDRFEVFVGHDCSPERSASTLVERPVVVSVLAGAELDGEQWRQVVTDWVDDPSRPNGLVVEIHANTGHQVWVDRVIDGDPVGQLDELLAHAAVLADSLGPWERG